MTKLLLMLSCAALATAAAAQPIPGHPYHPTGRVIFLERDQPPDDIVYLRRGSPRGQLALHLEDLGGEDQLDVGARVALQCRTVDHYKAHGEDIFEYTGCVL